MSVRRMHLMGYVIAGPTWHHNGAWRHAESDAEQALDPGRYEHIARVLEGGKFDGLFFVDTLALMEFYEGSFAAVVKNGGQIYMLEPLQLLATMARATERLGLSATMSTAFYSPFHIARAFATLDHISEGRAAWNIVTSTLTCEAQNFGLDAIANPDLRYDHADEVVQACCKLWESWEPDAIVYDRQNGIYADPAKGTPRELRRAMGENTRPATDTTLTAGQAGSYAGGLIGTGARFRSAMGRGSIHLAAREI